MSENSGPTSWFPIAGAKEGGGEFPQGNAKAAHGSFLSRISSIRCAHEISKIHGSRFQTIYN